MAEEAPAKGTHLDKVTEMVYQGEVPSVLCCDLVLAGKLEAVVE
jgi:hypothetical protein